MRYCRGACIPSARCSDNSLAFNRHAILRDRGDSSGSANRSNFSVTEVRGTLRTEMFSSNLLNIGKYRLQSEFFR